MDGAVALRSAVAFAGDISLGIFREDNQRRLERHGPEAKALNKALDRRHEVAVQQFARVRGADALAALWEQASHRGEIPGAWLDENERAPTSPDPRLRRAAG
jgi:hypothetical protein